MFHFSDNIDWQRFFRFDKRWIGNMNWAGISPAAKAVLPVIACHSNKQGEAFPAEETIAGLSGRTEKTIRQGIRDLKGFPGFDFRPYLTKRGRRSKKFYIDLPPKGERGRSFFFHRGIIDCGTWSELKPTAQALYPVMRYFSRFEEGADEELDDIDVFNERYAARNQESCIAEVGLLAKFAGIDRHNVNEAMGNLKQLGLLEPGDDRNSWTVFLTPKRHYKVSYLNQKLKQAVR